MQILARVDAWKPLGQATSLQQTLYAAARDEFGNAGIDLEIIPWLAGPGKTFLRDKFSELAREYIQTLRVRVMSETAIAVNLNAPPKYPVKTSDTLNVHGGMGWVLVEKRAEGLFVDGRRVVLHIEPGQHRAIMRLSGHTLRDMFKYSRPVLHPNILDALIDHQHFIPQDESWEKTDDHPLLGPSICFWAVIYTDGYDREYVRALRRRPTHDSSKPEWTSEHLWLSQTFGDIQPAAVLQD